MSARKLSTEITMTSRSFGIDGPASTVAVALDTGEASMTAASSFAWPPRFRSHALAQPTTLDTAVIAKSGRTENLRRTPVSFAQSGADRELSQFGYASLRST